MGEEMHIVISVFSSCLLLLISPSATISTALRDGEENIWEVQNYWLWKCEMPASLERWLRLRCLYLTVTGTARTVHSPGWQLPFCWDSRSGICFLAMQFSVSQNSCSSLTPTWSLFFSLPEQNFSETFPCRGLSRAQRNTMRALSDIHLHWLGNQYNLSCPYRIHKLQDLNQAITSSEPFSTSEDTQTKQRNPQSS